MGHLRAEIRNEPRKGQIKLRGRAYASAKGNDLIPRGSSDEPRASDVFDRRFEFLLIRLTTFVRRSQAHAIAAPRRGRDSPHVLEFASLLKSQMVLIRDQDQPPLHRTAQPIKPVLVPTPAYLRAAVYSTHSHSDRRAGGGRTFQGDVALNIGGKQWRSYIPCSTARQWSVIACPQRFWMRLMQ
jgi:hypothetical protein